MTDRTGLATVKDFHIALFELMAREWKPQFGLLLSYAGAILLALLPGLGAYLLIEFGQKGTLEFILIFLLGSASVLLLGLGGLLYSIGLARSVVLNIPPDLDFPAGFGCKRTWSMLLWVLLAGLAVMGPPNAVMQYMKQTGFSHGQQALAYTAVMLALGFLACRLYLKPMLIALRPEVEGPVPQLSGHARLACWLFLFGWSAPLTFFQLAMDNGADGLPGWSFLLTWPASVCVYIAGQLGAALVLRASLTHDGRFPLPAQVVELKDEKAVSLLKP